jgi:hypothetical protein
MRYIPELLQFFILLNIAVYREGRQNAPRASARPSPGSQREILPLLDGIPSSGPLAPVEPGGGFIE